jgi:hypothetical protein
MKRTPVACLLVALLAGTLMGPAEAARGRVSREAVDTYELPWPGSPSISQGCFGDDNCPSFTAAKSERWVSVEVTDDSGTPTAFRVVQITEGDHHPTETASRPFCGSTGEPVKVTRGAEVAVRVYALGDAVCPGSLGTSGTVTAVFSNLRSSP